MSDEIAIRVEGLGKKFQIGALRQGRATVGGIVRETFAGPVRRIGRLVRGQAYGATDLDETMWALRDISFTVPRGQVLGIIGANGAGKSTLLKILTRIMEPSEGRAVIDGRVSALLEVGTGFHPEMTGRENTYLNGTILGMTRAEISRKFDEIVAFAGVEKFIDTPVKHYSSGMKVRLGFAVAAHLEPEVLLIDEVLAVGDVAFQRKSLGKIDEVTRSGRTVLFVSHNMASVEALCHRVILLQDGHIAVDDAPKTSINAYLTSQAAPPSAADSVTGGSIDLRHAHRHVADSVPTLAHIRLLNTADQETDTVLMGAALRFQVTFDTQGRTVAHPDVGIMIYNGMGSMICRFDWRYMVDDLPEEANGCATVEALWSRVPLVPGTYTVALAFKSGSSILVDAIHRACAFTVLDGDIYGTGRSKKDGATFLPHVDWRIVELS